MNGTPGDERDWCAWPTGIDLPRALGRDPSCAIDVWWLTSRLTANGRNFATQVFFVGVVGGDYDMAVQVVATDLDQERCHDHLGHFDNAQIAVASDRLDIETPLATLRGSSDGGMEFQSNLPDGTSLDLTLRPSRPVIYNCGTGVYPLMGATTYQHSLGGIETSGTLLIDGLPLEARGESWFDRQRVSHFPPESQGFTWMGLSLDNGDTISLWDLSAGERAGRAWATVVDISGTHILTQVSPLADSASGHWRGERGREYPHSWRVSIPALDANLDVVQSQVHDAENLFTGVATIVGSCRGLPVQGHGFIDIAPGADVPR